MSNLEQRTILLTGASQGIGATTAGVLRDRGARLVAHHRGDAERDDLVRALGDENGETLKFASGDFMDDQQVDRLWEDAVAWRGRIDTLVLNAAMMWPHGGVDDDEDTWLASWQRHQQVNVLAQARLMRAAVRHYREHGGGVRDVGPRLEVGQAELDAPEAQRAGQPDDAQRGPPEAPPRGRGPLGRGGVGHDHPAVAGKDHQMPVDQHQPRRVLARLPLPLPGGGVDLAVPDPLPVTFVQLVERDALTAHGVEQLDRDRDEPEADRAVPDRTWHVSIMPEHPRDDHSPAPAARPRPACDVSSRAPHARRDRCRTQ